MQKKQDVLEDKCFTIPLPYETNCPTIFQKERKLKLLGSKISRQAVFVLSIPLYQVCCKMGLKYVKDWWEYRKAFNLEWCT